MSRYHPRTKFRSGCPLNASVEILGDRWSLLIIRDMMLRGFRSYTQFLDSYEHIATNILAHRLKKLEGYGIIATQRDPKWSSGPRLTKRLKIPSSFAISKRTNKNSSPSSAKSG
jgi:DNA-binding HxlR family transcriptional regulator